MAHSSNNGFYLADWRVNPHEGLVLRGDEVVHLEPLAMDVLVFLARHAGKVVSRDLLEKEVWHGAMVSYDAVTNTVIKLRKALQDDARQPRYIATIPKKGYQMIADVRWQSVDISDSKPFGDGPLPRSHSTRWSVAAIAVAILLVVLWFGFGNKNSVTQLPSIVVLPFTNLGEDKQQDYLADGMTEDITTDLSQMSGIRVLASNTALRYKDKHLSPEQVGEELDVKFVLKGSVRQRGGKLRVNVQLVDSTTGYNVWAERFDRKVGELFAVQDVVTQSIVRALALNLTSQEKQRLARQATANLQAYDYFQEGQRLFKISTRHTNQQAFAMYRKAVEIDPSYGRAFGAMAVVLANDYRNNWAANPMETLDRALQLAKKAVALDDSTPQTWWALGFVYLAHKNFDQAEKAAMLSIDVAPNYADGYGLLGIVNSFNGKPEKAISFNDKGVRLNPYYSYEYLITYGLAYYTLGQYEKAITVLEQAHQRNVNHVVIKYLLCASYIRAGKVSDAEWLAEELKLLEPTATLSNIALTIPLARTDIKHKFLNDLRLAGLPD